MLSMASPATDEVLRSPQTNFSAHDVEVQRRITPSAIGLPLHEESTLRGAFACVGEALQALLSLHDVGLVHQNISYANVLAINGSGRILDLDCAKQPEESARHGSQAICTITPFFISHEVESHCYLHRPYTPCEDEDLDDPRKINFRSDDSTNRGSIFSQRPEKIPFRQNALHDFESLFLLCVFLLLVTEFRKRPEDTPDMVSQFGRAHGRLFAVALSHDNASLRENLFTGGVDLPTLFKALHPSIRDIARRLDVVRDAFRSAYADAEAAMTPSIPIPHTAGEKLAAVFANQLRVCISGLRGSNLHFLKEPQLRSQSPAWSAVPVSRYVLQGEESSDPPQATASTAPLEARARHRILLDSVGEPISQIKSLHAMFYHLGHVFCGLVHLHRLGWTHKNISHDKIFIFENKAKLIDLDFAKTIDEGLEPYATHVNARLFASTEVYLHKYQHLPRIRRARTNPPTLMDPLTDFVVPPSPALSPIPHVEQQQNDIPLYPAFRYNPLHDLESMFWLCTFLLLASTYNIQAQSKPSQLSDCSTRQAMLYRRIFCEEGRRTLIMLSPSIFYGCGHDLYPKIANVMLNLDQMLAMLVDAFEEAEKAMDSDNPIPYSVGFWAGSAMGGVVLQICASFQTYGDLIRDVEDLGRS